MLIYNVNINIELINELIKNRDIMKLGIISAYTV